MKTLIVLCSLVTIVITLPTPLQDTTINSEKSPSNGPDSKTREKKSALYDTSDELALENGKENTQSRHSYKTKFIIPVAEKPKIVYKKPIIIKKKFGYHVYRDSDEEMAHADPYERCRKQFKVKLCDSEPLLVSDSNNAGGHLSERSHETFSEKEMKHSIKLAKEAVENLERDLHKMEKNSAKTSNSNENLESGIILQNDIEMAKNALEHIQKNIGNLESLEMQINDPSRKDTQTLKSIDEWKEAIDDIHKNVDIARNIEDAIKFETSNLHISEIPKIRQNEDSASHQTKNKFNTENLGSKDTPSNGVTYKTIHEDKTEKSNKKDEKNMNVENDMFVSTMDHKESNMKLHSESLTSENLFDKLYKADHVTNSENFQTNEYSKTLKSSENSEQNMAYENNKMVDIDTHKTNAKDAISEKMTLNHNNENNVESELPEGNNALKTLPETTDIPILNTKSSGDAENNKFIQESLLESNQCEDEHQISKTTVKPREVMRHQINSKPIVDEKPMSVFKMNPSEQTLSGIEVDQKHEQDREESSNTDSSRLSQVKVALLKEEEVKQDDLHVRLELDDNSSQQKHLNFLDSHSEPKENPINNEQCDLLDTSNTHAAKEKTTITQQSSSLSSTAIDLSKEPRVPNDFSTVEITENHNLNHMHSENHETQDYPLKHLSKEKEKDQISQVFKSASDLMPTLSKEDESLTRQNVFKDHTRSRMNGNSNMEDQLNEHNDIHELFMRLAEEKQSRDNNLWPRFKTIEKSINEHKIDSQTKNNEFESVYMPVDITNARMDQTHNMEQQLQDNHGLHNIFSMSLAPEKQPMDHAMQRFSNDHLLPTYLKTSGLKNEETDLNTDMSMRLVGGHNIDNMKNVFTENEFEHWPQEKQKVSQTFTSNTHLYNDDMFLTPTNTNGYNSRQYTPNQQMRITEFADSQELHPMHWAQEKRYNDDLSHTFGTEVGFNNEHHLNDHVHESMPTNRFNNNFDADNIHDSRPKIPDHFNLMKFANSNVMDSSMQPSMHIGMRDNDQYWGHHHHYGAARSSYSPSVANVSPNSGDVGVFSDTNSGCGLPLLVRCSPSVVSGSMARAQPLGMSAPAYRNGENFMYHMKRDSKKVDGMQSVKIQKTSMNN